MGSEETNYILDIELSKDGTYFTIKSIDSDILNKKYLVVSNENISNQYEFTIEDNLHTGVNISSNILFGVPVFEDGLYEFTIKDANNEVIVSTREGFLFNITNKIMVDSLSYRDSNDSYKRYIMIEKIRLLENIYYSAQLGLVDSFLENLKTLQKLV